MPALRTRDTASRTLEVITTTDEPLTPTLAILSPTPRAFTFPKHDPPFASPSTSPFELDLKSMTATPPPQRAFSPTSSIGSETSSLLSTPSTAPSSQVSHRRRRSTVSDNERRPKRGDEDYIKRPENAFILFRRKCCEDRQQAIEDADETAAPIKKQRQADLSKAISQQWKGLSSGERQYWEDLAKEKKKEHEQMYPNYVYRPQRIKKGRKGKGKRADGEQEGDDGISFIMPVPSPPRSLSRGANISHGGRRACSAPTPPPAFQTIQLPTVFMPSCPPSPMGIPRISRRASYVPPPNEADPSTSFEYMPHNAVLPPTFQRPHFDAMQPYDTFQTFNFDSQSTFPGRTNGVPLQSLSIPRDSQSSYDLVSPADSVASGLFSPADSIASPASSRSSHCGPFTPAEALTMTPLSIHQHAHRAAPDCVPENVDGEQQHITSELGYAGYTGWSADALWPDTSEVLLADDFDLSSIPPIELGTTMPDQNPQGYDGGEETPYPLMSDAYPEPGSEQDPFAHLFTSYGGGLTW